MPLALTVEHPDFPDDMVFGINDLGRVKNHGTLEIDEDTERHFILSRGMPLADAFKDNAVVSISGTSTLSTDELNELLPPPAEEDQEVTQDQTQDQEQGLSEQVGTITADATDQQEQQTEEGEQ